MDEQIYDDIGTGYNSTRKADPYLTSRIIDLLQPEKNKHYLDVGCGTGNYTYALWQQGIKFTGLDPSQRMLDEAKKHQCEIEWVNGNAENIPFPENSFQGAIATLTVHHWKNQVLAFREINRIMTPEGRFVLFTSTPEQMKGYWLNHYFPHMLRKSINQMPGFDETIFSLTKAGFEIFLTEKYEVRMDLSDHFLYAGKNNPLLYFDKNVRSGISSFAALSNEDEIEQGLALLASDMRNKKFAEVQHHYMNDSGDYLFIAAIKK